jgi:hypothetical protein
MSSPHDHPDPRVRKLAQKNAEAHRHYEAARDMEIRTKYEREQLAAKKAMQQIDPSIPYLADDIKMHTDNIRAYDDATQRSYETKNYRLDD